MPQLSLPFKLATWSALLGWLALALLPGWQHTQALVLYLVVALLALIYAWVLRMAMRQRPEPGADKPSFFTLHGVLALFRHPSAVLATWVRILAFDLMVALYIRSEGAAAGIGHGWLLPCYLLTMMFGPLGLLLFLGLRWVLV